MAITAKGPPYVISLERDGKVVHKPYIPELCPSMEQLSEIVGGDKLEWKSVEDWPEDIAHDNEALATLLGHKAPWEKKHQVGGTHYSDMAVQPWDAMRAWFTPTEYASYHIGTVIGYLSRHRRKGGLSDIKKAHHHLSELIRYFEEEEEYE